MTMKSLTQLRALIKDPQLLHKWEIIIGTWPTAAVPADPNILFLVTSSTVPEPEHEDATVELGGFKFTYNGKESRNGSVSWNFVENTSNDVIKYFFVDYANVRQNHKDITEITLGSADNASLIAPLVTMNLYDASGKKITKQIQLINCMFKPKSFGGDFGQSPEVQKPDVEVTFDSFVWVLK